MLKLLSSDALTEKRIAKRIGINLLVIGPILTQLLMDGYVETLRRRKFLFFSREYFVITLEGIYALETSKHPAERLLEHFGRTIVASIAEMSEGSFALKVVAWCLLSVRKLLVVL